MKGAPGWSIKNSGIMLHSQHPSTMLLDQDFPVSSEVQLLGGLGTGERSTANMCSPGIDVDINSEKAKYHCVNSNSKTYHNDDWVKVEVIVKSNNIVHHIVENDTVISYSNLRVGGDKIPENYSPEYFTKFLGVSYNVISKSSEVGKCFLSLLYETTHMFSAVGFKVLNSSTSRFKFL